MIKGKVRAIHSDVLVKGMHFGETKTAGGIIIQSDDAKAHGIKPRWAEVYNKGPENKDPYEVGDWILIEHGRWTRKIEIQDEKGEKIELQKVEVGSIIAWQEEAPSDLAYFGEEYNHGATATYDPGMFVNN
jgi:co-chaperonin GroES (HSP10)